jgi:muconolactone delta-isomerase
VEFLTDLVTNVPDGTPETEVEATKAAEKLRAGELVKHPNDPGTAAAP